MVRRAVTLVMRHPAKGSLAMNPSRSQASILVVPVPTRPGAAGIGIRVSPIS